MKLALLGYGKMGKAIETIALERGHSVGVTIDDEDDWMDKIEELRQCDMAIDFSTPGTAVSNIMRCFDLDMPIVVGTTGWYGQLESVVHDCRQRGKSLFVASNFSIGMNMVFDLNRRLALLMNGHGEYAVGITETHHVHKLDAPSGTAIALARDIVEAQDEKVDWQLLHEGERWPMAWCRLHRCGRARCRASTRWCTTVRWTASHCVTKRRAVAAWPLALCSPRSS